MPIELTAPQAFTRTRAVWSARLQPYVWLLPALALFGLFRLYPLLFGFFLSLHKWDGMAPMVFVGLANFKEALFDDPLFWRSLSHNAIYALGTVVGKNVLALGLAVMLNAEIRGRAFFRTTLFMPVVMSLVVVGILWSWIYNYQFGLLNNLLQTVGLDRLRAEWLGNTSLALYAVIVVDIWKFFGYHMVIYLAGLQCYPARTLRGRHHRRSLDVAAVPPGDPAHAAGHRGGQPDHLPHGGLQRLRSRVRDDAGRPDNATSVVVLDAYQQAFEFYKLGYGAAISILLMLIVIVLSLVQIRLMRGARAEEYN